jgi:hypothetical protein
MNFIGSKRGNFMQIEIMEEVPFQMEFELLFQCSICNSNLSVEECDEFIQAGSGRQYPIAIVPCENCFGNKK